MIHVLHKIKVGIVSLLLISSANLLAFPRGCEERGFIYSGEDLILNTRGAQAFFLIQNTMSHPIIIERYVTQESWFTPKLHATFSPGSWSAFATNVTNMQFKCAVWNGDVANVIPCSEAVKICQYPRAGFAVSNMGSYWVSSNKTQTQTIQDSVAKGIYLHW